MSEATRACTVGGVRIGADAPPVIIAGPCLLETKELGLTIGRHLQRECVSHGLPYIFKASFDKANRSSIRSSRGPGAKVGLRWLSDIRAELGVPATTDIHEPSQADHAAEAVDLFSAARPTCSAPQAMPPQAAAAPSMSRKASFFPPRRCGAQ